MCECEKHISNVHSLSGNNFPYNSSSDEEDRYGGDGCSRNFSSNGSGRDPGCRNSTYEKIQRAKNKSPCNHCGAYGHWYNDNTQNDNLKHGALSSPKTIIMAGDEPICAKKGSGSVVHPDNTTVVDHLVGNHCNAAHHDNDNSSVDPASNGQNSSKHALKLDKATLATRADTWTGQAATVDNTSASSDICIVPLSAVEPLADYGSLY